MSAQVCFYFQIHQPWRLRDYRHADVGLRHDYFDDAANAAIVRRVAHKCYLPMCALLGEAIAAHAPHLRLSFSVSGCALQQLQRWAPEVLRALRALHASGQVEWLGETSHHTLAALYDSHEFAQQVRLQRRLCTRLLGPVGRVLRNTELIASDAVIAQAAALGATHLLLEGAEGWLGARTPLAAYRCAAAPQVLALPRAYRLSDDIAFRFSDRNWPCWPLRASQYADWLQAAAQGSGIAAPMIGLFMDFETFGEHQWADSGIFEFMRALPGEVLRRGLAFATPGRIGAASLGEGPCELPRPYSWADQERDVSAWRGNAIQQEALQRIYALGARLRALPAGVAGNALREDWRRLQTSDHFYYMATKHWSDGEVHKYFSPFESPYDAYVVWMHALDDLQWRLQRLERGTD